MKYRVYNCANSSEVYEDRVYRCYGVFMERGLTYTAVRRLDLPTKVSDEEREDGVIINVIDIVIIRSVLSASPSRMETIQFTRSLRPGRIAAGERILRTRGWC